MQIDEVASIALDTWDESTAQIMVAIAGAESGFDERAAGDALSIFSPGLQQAYAPFAYNSHLSFGLWQIFLGVHTPLIRSFSGLSAPEQLAGWLSNPRNNALAAKEILSSQGFQAWSTYNNQAYLDFEIEGSAAIRAAKASRSNPSPRQIVAFSINPPTIHFDLADGSFLESTLTDIHAYGDWLRYEIIPLDI